MNVLGEAHGHLTAQFATPSSDKFAGVRVTGGTSIGRRHGWESFRAVVAKTTLAASTSRPFAVNSQVVKARRRPASTVARCGSVNSR